MNLILSAMVVAGVCIGTARAQAPAQSPFGQQDAVAQPRSETEVDRRIKELGSRTLAEREALEQEFRDQRRQLVDGLEFSALSRSERKARLQSLREDADEKASRLDAEYQARRQVYQRQKRLLQDEPEINGEGASAQSERP